MQALDVVDIVDKLANISRRLLKGLILPEVDLLLLEGLKETFGFGVVVGMVATQALYLGDIQEDVNGYLRENQQSLLVEEQPSPQTT